VAEEILRVDIDMGEYIVIELEGSELRILYDDKPLEVSRNCHALILAMAREIDDLRGVLEREGYL